MSLDAQDATEASPGPSPKLILNFNGYSPSFDVERVASRMIASVPSNFLYGLESIVFTNMYALSRKRQKKATWSRKRKVRIGNTAGLYHGKWQGKGAWIEVFVDKAMYDNGRYRWVFKMPFIRDIFLSNILFHEIGHHIHATAQPEFREKEDVADKWKLKLQKRYMRGRYPMLIAIVQLMRPLIIKFVEPLVKPSDAVIRSIEGRRR